MPTSLLILADKKKALLIPLWWEIPGFLLGTTKKLKCLEEFGDNDVPMHLWTFSEKGADLKCAVEEVAAVIL